MDWSILPRCTGSRRCRMDVLDCELVRDQLMRRREFITLFGSAAAWPLTAHAQQRMKRIGVLMADDPETQARLAAFAQGLQQLGWTVGQNVLVDYRFGNGNAD